MSKNELLTKVRLAGLMSKEDEERLAEAVAKWDQKTQDELFEKYKKKEKKADEALAYSDEEDTEPISNSKQSVLIYNQFRKTLKVEMIKEDVLIEHKHTCFYCKHEYPTKEDFKRNHKKKTYPLFVRSLINVPRYIEINKIISVQECLDNPDLRNKNYYLPICLDCKPSRFAK